MSLQGDNRSENDTITTACSDLRLKSKTIGSLFKSDCSWNKRLDALDDSLQMAFHSGPHTLSATLSGDSMGHVHLLSLNVLQSSLDVRLDFL